MRTLGVKALVIGVLLSCFGSVPTNATECEYHTIESVHIVGGQACVPSDLQRIAVLDPYFNLQMGLFLDLPIVAAARSGPDWPPGAVHLATLEELKSLRYLGQFQEPSLEELLGAQPDLILGDAYMHRRLLNNLEKIAPTVLIDTADWKTYFATIGMVTRRLQKAEESLRSYQERVRSLHAVLEDAASVSFLRIVPGGFQVYVEGPSAYAPVAILTELGIPRPAGETTDGDTVFLRPTWEGVPLLEGDILLYVFGGGHHVGGESRLVDETLSHPLWASIPAVRSNRAYQVSADHWTSFGGLHSAHAILDDIERIFDVQSQPQ